jgi:hypothetical protein
VLLSIIPCLALPLLPNTHLNSFLSFLLYLLLLTLPGELEMATHSEPPLPQLLSASIKTTMATATTATAAVVVVVVAVTAL